MAESDADRRDAGAVTTEEADRLSEQFRPSWEDDPPTVPREPAARPAPEPKQKVAAPLPAAAPRAPVVNVTAPKGPAVARPAAVTATAKESPAAKTSPDAAQPIPLAKRATLLGVSPPVAPKPSATGARGQGVDDLDWELPAGETAPLAKATDAAPASDAATTLVINARPEPAAPPPKPAAEGEAVMAIDVEELPPESKPSGIGQKYVPKDEGAPAVILGADIQAAEYGTQVQHEAEHRTRRAPTIAKLKAIDIPIPTPASPEVEYPRPKRKGFGMVALLAVITLLGGAGGAAYLVRSGATERAEQPGPATPAPPAVTADTRAPKPVLDAPAPTPTPPEAAPGATGLPTAPPEMSAQPAAQGSEPDAPVKPEVAPSPAPVKPTVKPVAAKPTPAPKPAAPKPVAVSKPTPAPTPKPAAPSKPSGGSKGSIVRDTPF